VVTPGDLEQVLLVVTASEELREQVWITSDVCQPGDHGRRPRVEEVASDPDVFDTSNLADVIDVVGDLRDGSARMR
jgi:hypothetical protein